MTAKEEVKVYEDSLVSEAIHIIAARGISGEAAVLDFLCKVTDITKAEQGEMNEPE